MGLMFATKGLPYAEDFPYEERASWSYEGFDLFRDRLAREILGAELKTVLANPELFRRHALFPLVSHSDRIGELSPEECRRVGPALMLTALGWSEEDYDRVHSIKLVKHMAYCVETGQALEFR